MAKGIIKEILEDHAFMVEVQRDNTRIENKIARLEQQISSLNHRISALDETEQENKERLELQRDNAESERNKCIEVRDTPPVYTMKALGEDRESLVVGMEVGTIERRKANGIGERFINYPAAYNPARDGRQVHAASMSPWNWLYSTLTEPVLYVWRPRYCRCRINTIAENNLTARIEAIPLSRKGEDMLPLSQSLFDNVPAAVAAEVTNYIGHSVGDEGLLDFVSNPEAPQFITWGDTENNEGDGPPEVPPLPDVDYDYEILDKFTYTITPDWARFEADLRVGRIVTMGGHELREAHFYANGKVRLSNSGHSYSSLIGMKHNEYTADSNFFRADPDQLGNGSFFGSRQIWNNGWGGWHRMFITPEFIDTSMLVQDSAKSVRTDSQSVLDDIYNITYGLYKMPVSWYSKSGDTFTASGYLIRQIY